MEDASAGEVSRRTFMAKATLFVGGVIGLGLAIPVAGSLLAEKHGTGTGEWSPLLAKEFEQLRDSDTPVQLHFRLSAKDAYLPRESLPEYVWGIRVPDAKKFESLRPDVFADGHADVPYDVVNLGFVILSPICPHLACRPQWHADAKRFACPCHGSQFGYDGQHLAGPAPRGMDPLPLREQKGRAEVMWIRYKSGVPDRMVISYRS